MINLSFFGANGRISDYRSIKNGTSSIEINTFCIFLHSLSVDHKRLFLLSIHCFYSNDLNCSKNVCVRRAMLRNVASI